MQWVVRRRFREYSTRFNAIKQINLALDLQLEKDLKETANC